MTITTVGYGNVVPVTVVGQLMAVVLMFSGVALLGVLAGTLASFFGFGDSDEHAEDAAQVPVDAAEQVTADATVGEISPGSRTESSLTVTDPLDLAALRARLADLDDALAVLRSQLQ